MGRIRIVQKPLPFQPKSCVISGRADGDIVDFGAECGGIDPHLYLRRDIVEKSGKACGMLSEAEAGILQSEREDLIAENAMLRSEAKTTNLQHFAEIRAMSLAAGSVAAATVIKHNPEAEVPVEAIEAAVEELFEPTKEEIVK